MRALSKCNDVKSRAGDSVANGTATNAIQTANLNGLLG